MRNVLYRIFSGVILVTVLSLLLSACGTSRSAATARGGGSAVSSSQKVHIPSSLAPQSRSLLKEVDGWLGTPYRYGGESRDGIDCSALMLRVYNDALSIKIPRNSRAQSDYCTPIDRSSLIPGDLLFFATTKGSRQVSHVGMYIGDGKMVHSSASRGVIVSDIDADYYLRTFAGAGRVEPYHAMLGPSGKKKNNGKNNGTGNAPLPSPENPEALPFTFEPVASLPTPAATPATAERPVEPVVSTVATTAPVAAGTTPEISPELARLKVLDEIIEQKIDSIVAN